MATNIVEMGKTKGDDAFADTQLQQSLGISKSKKKGGDRKMKKLLLILPLTIILLLGTAGTAFADDGEGIGARCGQAGKSNTGHMYLYEKNPDPDGIPDTGDEWSIVDDGAWAKMKYNLSGNELKFVFNGHDLDPGQSYSLIYYPDDWPGEGLIILGEGAVNEEGNIHLMGSIETGTDLPATYDQNFGTGAKIWLVLSDDVGLVDTEDPEGPKKMTGWNQPSYLFEYDLINYTDSGEVLAKGKSGNSGKGAKPDKPNKPDKTNKPDKPNK